MIIFKDQIDLEKLDKLKPFHRAIQAMMCISSHKQLNMAIPRISACRHLDGGVNVGGHEVWITRKALSDIDNEHKEPIILEAAVLSSLEEIIKELDPNNIKNTSVEYINKRNDEQSNLWQKLIDFASNRGFGPPLTALFKLQPEDDAAPRMFGMNFFHR